MQIWLIVLLSVIGGLLFLFLVACGVIAFFIEKMFYRVDRRNTKVTLPTSEDGKISYRIPYDWEKKQTKEEWGIVSKDGLKLRATLIRNGNSHRYFLFIHGFHGVYDETLLPCKMAFEDFGANALAPDERASNGSEGKLSSLGFLETDDALLWIEEIKRRDPDASVVLAGQSMGGFIVMRAIDKLPPYVAAVIEDCGFSSAYEEIGYPFPKSIRWLVLFVATIFFRLRFHVSLKKDTTAKTLPHAKAPILLIHGTADRMVPFSFLDKNVKQVSPSVQKMVLVVEGADHTLSLYTDEDKYHSVFDSFLRQFWRD